MHQTFDLPLIDSANIHKGVLRITYNDHGLTTADYYINNRLADRIPWLMLQSTLFAPVMEQIEAAIANNRDSLKQDHSHLTIPLT